MCSSDLCWFPSHDMGSMNNRQNAQCGQVGLVVLLIGAVLLTVGIGVASQSIIETKTARQETESSQTFNYTEQGVEALLGQDLASLIALGKAEGKFDDPEIGVVLDGYTGTYKVEDRKELNSIVLSGHSMEVQMPALNEELIIEWSRATPTADNASIIVTILRVS